MKLRDTDSFYIFSNILKKFFIEKFILARINGLDEKK